MHWFNKNWWMYLLFGVDYPKKIRKPNWTAFVCRIRNHPYGVYWYNASGLEPDERCINCGDDLG